MSSSESDFDRGEAEANVNRKEKVKQQPKSQHLHQCPVCKKTFAYRQGKSRHQRLENHYESAKERFCCSVCAKIFSTAANLEKHQKIHEEQQHSEQSTSTEINFACYNDFLAWKSKIESDHGFNWRVRGSTTE